MKRNYAEGQVGLMLLVVMAIVISIVLSIASRSLSDVSLSRQERENSSTFALAETGVEEALSSLTQGEYDLETTLPGLGVTGNYSIQEQKSYDMYVDEGMSAQIDLSGSPTNVYVNWVKNGESPTGPCDEGSGNAPAALEIILIDTDTYVATRSYYNAYGCNLTAKNNFPVASAPAVSNGFSSAVGITVGTNKMMRIKPLYHGTTVNVTGTGLASQLYLIQSEATGGDAKTDIEVKRGLNSAPSIFDFALFSDTVIMKP